MPENQSDRGAEEASWGQGALGGKENRHRLRKKMNLTEGLAQPDQLRGKTLHRGKRLKEQTPRSNSTKITPVPIGFIMGRITGLMPGVYGKGHCGASK